MAEHNNDHAMDIEPQVTDADSQNDEWGNDAFPTSPPPSAASSPRGAVMNQGKIKASVDTAGPVVIIGRSGLRIGASNDGDDVGWAPWANNWLAKAESSSPHQRGPLRFAGVRYQSKFFRGGHEARRRESAAEVPNNESNLSLRLVP